MYLKQMKMEKLIKDWKDSLDIFREDEKSIYPIMIEIDYGMKIYSINDNIIQIKWDKYTS
jgi:hypothetical protein